MLIAIWDTGEQPARQPRAAKGSMGRDGPLILFGSYHSHLETINYCFFYFRFFFAVFFLYILKKRNKKNKI